MDAPQTSDDLRPDDREGHRRVALGPGRHPASGGRHHGHRSGHRDRRTTTAARPASRCRAGRGARCSPWRWAASSCSSPTTSRAGRASCSTATCTNACSTLAPFIHWDGNAVPLDGGRPDRLRRRRLHHEHRATRTPSRPTWAAAGSATRGRRCGPPWTPTPGRVTLYLTDPDRPAGARLGRGLPEPVPAGRRDARGSCATGVRYPEELFDAQAAAYQRFHTDEPRRPRQRLGRLVAPDRPVRAARGRRAASTSTSRTRTTSGSRCSRRTPTRLRPGAAGPSSCSPPTTSPARGRTWSRR